MYYKEKVSRNNKIKNTNQDTDGVAYHSKLEAHEGQNLIDKLEKKEIMGFTRQYKLSFYLAPVTATKCNETIHVLRCNPSDYDRSEGFFMDNYYIDFMVEHLDGTIELIEVKGQQTQDWRKKWNMTEAIFGKDPGYLLKVKT